MTEALTGDTNFIPRYFYKPVFNWGNNFIRSLDFSKSNKLLEIGCRDGALTENIANRYPKQFILAIDPNNASIEKAKGNFTRNNVTFEQRDLLHLEMVEKFDVVFSSSYLHWHDDKLNLLQQIFQALKPGGSGCLQFFGKHGNLKNDRFLYFTSQQATWSPYFSQFSPSYSEVSAASMAVLLQKVGFNIKRLEFVRHEVTFEHSDQLHSWLKTWATHIDRVPLHRQDHFLAETVGHYIEHYSYKHNRPFPYHEYLLQIVCEKPGEKQVDMAPLPFPFTPQEINVLRPYLKGCTAKEIANHLGISSKTVEFHITNLKDKTQSYRRSQLFSTLLNSGLLDLIF